MYRFDFSYDEYQRFLTRCPFSDEELQILELKRRGKSNVAICDMLSLSESVLARQIKRIHSKIMKEI